MEAREASATSGPAGKPAKETAEAPAGVATLPAVAAATGAGAAPAKSPLDKPLRELTEEDIAQVTREDCRRYLKDKGMRRPSWNKSQAIQQVISLKALLEGRHDPDAAADDAPSIPAFFPKRPPDAPLPVPVAAPQISVPPPLGLPPPRGDPAVAEQQMEAAPGSLPPPYPRRDPPAGAAVFSGADARCRFTAAGGGALTPNTAGLPPRLAAAGEGEAPAGQLTVFYDGRVNVYEGVTPEKARVIMQIAASPSYYDLPPVPPWPPLSNRPQCHDPAQLPPSQAAAGGGSGCFRPPPPPAPAPPVVSPQISQSSGRLPQHFRESMEEWRIPREVEAEGPTSRAASLQRYFEKRKDRFKCKKHVAGSSNMEMFWSQRMRDQMPNGQIGYSSPNQAPRSPQTPTRCNSVQDLRLSIDLNDDDIQEG
uniref:Protein TIFY n=2 Tax=Anthurium amnicola TaxID=1678845 RepID=A0A1D1Y484_9ARAE